jgi:thioredoxin-dependent peroxiredoxin
MAPVSAARRALAAITLVALAGPIAASAQTPAPPPPPTGPKVGEMAPDFTLPGATRYGRLRDPVTLSSLRGSTVVLAFFIKARTRG